MLVVVHNVFGLAVKCLELPDIANGGVTWTGLSAGNVANYTCTSGYELVGSPTRLCGDDGTWSGDEPFCRRKINFNMHVHVYILYSCSHIHGLLYSVKIWYQIFGDFAFSGIKFGNYSKRAPFETKPPICQTNLSQICSLYIVASASRTYGNYKVLACQR